MLSSRPTLKLEEETPMSLLARVEQLKTERTKPVLSLLERIGKNFEEMKAALDGKGSQYDVVFSNPPYQVNDGGGGTGFSAVPIYNRIVEYTIDVLKPHYVCMITPSRWMAGGKGLDQYRERMLKDRRLRLVQDFPGNSEVFKSAIIGGGVSYFLWDKNYSGLCEFNSIQRDLNEFDILVRDGISLPILKKVLAKHQEKFCNQKVLASKPFGIRAHFDGWVSEKTQGATKCYNRGLVVNYTKKYSDSNNAKDSWKVCVTRMINPNAEGRFEVYQRLFIIEPGAICTETYLVAGCFNSKKEAENYIKYMKTRFYRFMLSLRIISQDISREKFSWVPDLGNYSKAWTDKDLYAHFELTKKEIEHIEKSVKAGGTGRRRRNRGGVRGRGIAKG